MDSALPPNSQHIVDTMMKTDAFSKWLGINVEEVRPGFVRLSMKVTSEMLNGFGIAHGGICYSLADSALAFAANGHGHIALSTHTSIVHLTKVELNDTLTAETVEKSRDIKNARYKVTILNQNGKLAASFEGTVHITSKIWKL